ncbi:MAG: hypothetical protein P4L57_02615 [Rhizomicrobium sp.]|nr:hypothetical protein [Rhizomicrobium sp.]
MKRLLPVLVLYLLAPLVAEFLSGSMAMANLSALLHMVPFYGSGAVLVREVARRSGRGWLALPFLALAFGIIEEGIVDQSLFNPNFLGAHLLAFGYLPSLGIAAPWTVFVLGIHILWSMAVPIALTELLFASRRTEPWLGNIGLGIVALIYVAIAALATVFLAKYVHFWATPSQLEASAIAALVAMGLAFAIPRHWLKPTGRTLPAWLVAVIAFALGSAFIMVYGAGTHVWHWPWQLVTAGTLALLVLMQGFGLAALRSATWSNGHRYAATAGGLLVYCWSGFGTDAALHGLADRPAHAVLAAAMLLLLLFTGWLTVRRAGKA